MSYQTKKLFKSLRENTIFGIKFYFSAASTSYFIPKLSRFINKFLYWIGLASSLNRYDNSITLYSSFSDRKLYNKYSKTAKFINFGSGAFFHSRWKNYDYPGQSSYYKSLQGKQDKDFNPIDLCNENLSLPELSDSVELIYCSHTLEHLDKDSSLRFIKECQRILVKGGVLRVALPNTKNDFYLLRCLMKQRNVLDGVIKNYAQDASPRILFDTKDLDFDSLMELLREASFESHAFYKILINKHPEMSLFDGNKPERHINYWDFDNLADVVFEFGFEAIIPTYQGSSVASPFCNLHVFDTTEPHATIYADIIK
jgi:SAM-dependent methyltransferase